MSVKNALKLFDGLAAELRAGRSEEARPLLEKLRALDARAVEDLLHRLELKRAEDKALVIGFQNALALPAMKKLAAERGALEKVRGLVLIPFCLQAAPCPHKIIWDSDN